MRIKKKEVVDCFLVGMEILWTVIIHPILHPIEFIAIIKMAIEIGKENNQNGNQDYDG